MYQLMFKPQFVLGLVLTVCVATVGFAQEDAKKAKQGKSPEQQLEKTTANYVKSYKAANLTDEQRAQVKAIVNKHLQELMDSKKTVMRLVSAEQKKSMAAAKKQAKNDGLKGREMSEQVYASLNMSESDLAAYKQAEKQANAVNKKIELAIFELLTDEQKASLPKKLQPKKGKKEKGKKEKGKKEKGKKAKVADDVE